MAKSPFARKMEITLISLFIYAWLIGFAFYSLFPLYWLFSYCFKSPTEALSYPPTLSPHTFTLHNITIILTDEKWIRYFINTMVVALGTMLLAVPTGSCAGYSFARYNFRYKNTLFFTILFLYMIPFITLIIPLYQLLSFFNLLDTYYGLILCNFILAVPFIIWLMRGFFETIPWEIEEAALIDGCTRFMAFLKVIFPLSAPALATSAIYTFIVTWNNFVIPLILCSSDPGVMTYTIALYHFFGMYGEVNWALLSAAAVIAFFPIIAVFSFFQKYFIAGLTGGAIKG